MREATDDVYGTKTSLMYNEVEDDAISEVYQSPHSREKTTGPPDLIHDHIADLLSEEPKKSHDLVAIQSQQLLTGRYD